MELRRKLSEFLAAWGLSPTPATDAANEARSDVDVVLEVAGPSGAEALVVGTLSSHSGEYIFQYSEDFKRRLEIPPIGAFPDRQKIYRSPLLWPFFQVRLPPLDRPDVKQVVQARNLDKEDLMALLRELGSHAVTSPYNLVPHGSRG